PRMYRQAANGGPQNHFGLAALTTRRGPGGIPGGRAVANLGGNIVLIQPSGTRPTVVCKSYCFCSRLCNARCIPTFGYRRVHAILKRQVLAVNHKRVYPGDEGARPRARSVSSTLVRHQKAAAGELTRR